MRQPTNYKGFDFTWPDPPLTSGKWVVNVSSTDFWLFTKLGKNKVVYGATFYEALEKARRLIDHLE